MNLEIERRFLIKNNLWRSFITHQVNIIQGYFVLKEKDWTIRIRLEGEKYKLTLKKHIINSTSHEFEYDIPANEGEIILSNLDYTIAKERFHLFINDKHWTIDCFKDKNYPLIIGEIELQEVNEKIKLPNFIDKEITGIKKFTNFELSQNPFSIW